MKHNWYSTKENVTNFDLYMKFDNGHVTHSHPQFFTLWCNIHDVIDAGKWVIKDCTKILTEKNWNNIQKQKVVDNLVS